MKNSRNKTDAFLEEELITQILTILDAWKDNAVGQEKKDIGKVIKTLADDKAFKLEKYQKVVDLLDKYPDFTNIKLSKCLDHWEKSINPKQEADEDILPSWLFEEKSTKTPNPKPKVPKLVKKKDESLKNVPHTSCSLCEKTKFYSKADFIRAHGINRLEPNIWVYTVTQPNKKEPVFWYRWLCKACKQENHSKACKYYSSPIRKLILPEIFEWEDYWKWWFGVLTLDWDSKRFFGKYE